MSLAPLKRRLSGWKPPTDTGRTTPEYSPTLWDEGPMPELTGAVGWLNSSPLTRDSLKGKVVLADIWTYSCINSLRQLPYLKNWAEKYKDAGLVVIGVHSPEFSFERERSNVEEAVKNLELPYPNAIDSKMEIWNSFNNEYWPADYFIDGKGRVRHHHFGEGDYDESESALKQLLKENGAQDLDETLGSPQGKDIQAPFSTDVRTQETYVGYLRTENFASPEKMRTDSSSEYSLPTRLDPNHWGLEGFWKVSGESATLQAPNGRIQFRFHARDLHMVLGPSEPSKSTRLTVKLDGAAPGNNHGVDSNPDGSGEVQAPRLYQLIRQQDRTTDRTFEIEFSDPGVQAYSFTFG